MGQEFCNNVRYIAPIAHIAFASRPLAMVNLPKPSPFGVNPPQRQAASNQRFQLNFRVWVVAVAAIVNLDAVEKRVTHSRIDEIAAYRVTRWLDSRLHFFEHHIRPTPRMVRAISRDEVHTPGFGDQNICERTGDS